MKINEAIEQLDRRILIILLQKIAGEFPSIRKQIIKSLNEINKEVDNG